MVGVSQVHMCIITLCHAYLNNGKTYSYVTTIVNQEPMPQCTDNNPGVVYSPGIMVKVLNMPSKNHKLLHTNS